MIEHKLKLKFDDSFNGVLFSTQGDTGRVFEIEVRDELDNAIDITGHKLEFYVGNDSKVTKVEASISGNKFIVKPVNEQFTKSGLNKAQFVLYDPQGLQVGSQIFDLHVEESIQNGATVGANVLVDFSKINEAVKLIKGYEKTFEESKNLDTTLSAHIDEGRKVNQELISNTSAAQGLSENLKTSTTKASETYTKLEASRTGADTLNNDIKTNIASGNKTNANLQASISTAKNTQSTLQEKTAQGIDANTKLGQSIKTGQNVVSKINTADKNLATSIANADKSKSNLDASVGKANTAKTNLDGSIASANTVKTNLDKSTQAGSTTDSKLKDTDTKAGTSIRTLQDLLNQSTATEQNLKDIIASGNLDKYVTEPKLQEALAKIKTLKKEVVDALPSTGQDDVIYLVKDAKGKANNVYLEYLWINNAFELIGSTEVDLSGYAKTKDLKDYAKKSDIRPEAKFKTMTAVIDQANSNPLTCVTYEDDARLMEKGSKAWDEFFGAKLVLFKDGKEVRDLKDSELSSLTEADGDVMVKFKRMGLRINTVGDKVYVSMTDNPNSPDFKYYAHTRGDAVRDAFYLGAYLGYEKDGKLRSIKGFRPTGNKTIGAFRTIAQANGSGYEQMGYYQWMYLQCMYILKYGNLDSQTALGKGLTGGSYDESNCKNTGGTNGKGADFGSTDSMLQMRFQFIEDMWGNKYQWVDGFGTKGGSLWIGNDKFNDDKNGYEKYSFGVNGGGYLKKAAGNTEQGFAAASLGGSSSTYYCDYGYYSPSSNYFARVGGSVGCDSDAGAFYGGCRYSSSEASWSVGARLMFI